MGMLIKKMVRMAVALVTKLIFIAVGVVICYAGFSGFDRLCYGR